MRIEWAKSTIDYQWLIAQAPTYPKSVLDVVARRYADAIDAQILAEYLATK